jgi:hypothetical protein
MIPGSRPKARGGAEIVTFPLATNKPLVRRWARRMAAAPSAAAGRRALHVEISRRFNAMVMRGIPDHVAEQCLRSFEAAVDAELWRFVLTPPQPTPGDAA